MVELMSKVLTNVLLAIYQSFWFSILFAFFFMYFYLFAFTNTERADGLKSAIHIWEQSFKNSKDFRKLFFLMVFVVMILFRTLLNRDMWGNPLSDVIGNWWIYTYNSSGEKIFTTECLENIILFMPLTYLMQSFRKQKVYKLIIYSFLFSLSIELLQLFLRLGTFQLSDLFYNTLGGIAGGLLYWIIHTKTKICKKNRNVDQ